MEGWRPRATTQLACVIGHPIRHSLSPDIVNAAFRALDMDWVYLAFEVPAGSGGSAVDAMRALGIRGASVTMPHKAAVVAAVDEVSPVALRLAAVNAIWARGTELVGDNTDGAGFLDALRHDEGFDPAGRSAVVIGAGGAARAVIDALARAGASSVVVVNRTPARGEAAAALAPGVGRVGSADEVGDVDLVVNATPLGMAGAGLSGAGDVPLDPSLLAAGQVVCDLVYEPQVTPLMAAAKEAGAVAVGGLGMLIHQAAHAFRLWTGEDPPLEVMSAAAMRSLAARVTGS